MNIYLANFNTIKSSFVSNLIEKTSKLKAFPMDGSLFSIQLKFFRIVGFHRDLSSAKFPRLLRVFQILRIVCIMLCLPAEFAFLSMNFRDVVAAAESVGASFTEIITLGKLITFYLAQEKFYELIDEVHKLSADSNLEDSSGMERVNQQHKTMTILYLIAAFIAGTGLSILPLAMNVINITLYGSDYNFEMPMKTFYPYDIEYFPVYHLHYLMYCTATFITVFISVSTLRSQISIMKLIFATLLGCSRFIVSWNLSEPWWPP